jgi:hypothetical protein
LSVPNDADVSEYASFSEAGREGDLTEIKARASGHKESNKLEEEDNKIWRVVAWELRDLSTLKTRPRTEFNAGFGDLAVVRLLGSSDRAAHLLSLGGQSVLDDPDSTRGSRRRWRNGRPSHAIG